MTVVPSAPGRITAGPPALPYPYHPDPTNNPNAITDAPLQGLLAGYSEVDKSQQFTTHLEWKSVRDPEAIYVSIAQITWGWIGHAFRPYLTSPWTTGPATSHWEQATGPPTTTFPEWTEGFSDYD